MGTLGLLAESSLARGWLAEIVDDLVEEIPPVFGFL
jgi:hypothetical protein